MLQIGDYRTVEGRSRRYLQEHGKAVCGSGAGFLSGLIGSIIIGAEAGLLTGLFVGSFAWKQRLEAASIAWCERNRDVCEGVEAYHAFCDEITQPH
ncbi:hypothetical protein SAMN04488087_0642 [Rhodothermus profundi]|uniref:Uncharacterized protein n=1 Tax=Rhodothermus profundi TaxID=633813 RepID=A0A1M6QJ27_9BACT|nr:hypothetical protein SAMN04488087_0642 [Rhodothermus profundi]